MKKLLAIALVVSLILSLGVGSVAVLAKGNGAPSGQHYNLNLIGAPYDKNANFDGGNGARIFIDRTGTTTFYVGTGNFAILDHDGTDGTVGTSRANPGILFPYSNDAWQVQIWVRLVGPMDADNHLHWISKYWDGSTWVLFSSFTLNKSSKFTEKTSDLLEDLYEDILWELTPGEKFRICQMRIYLS